MIPWVFSLWCFYSRPGQLLWGAVILSISLQPSILSTIIFRASTKYLPIPRRDRTNIARKTSAWLILVTTRPRIQDTKDGLLRGLWPLDPRQRDFRRWSDGSQSQLPWINGDPDKGKTMLLWGIINELENDTNHRLSYFFHQVTERWLSNATSELNKFMNKWRRSDMLAENQPSARSNETTSRRAPLYSFSEACYIAGVFISTRAWSPSGLIRELFNKWRAKLDCTTADRL